MCATCSVHLTLIGLIAMIFGGQHQSQSSSCYFLHPRSKYSPQYHVLQYHVLQYPVLQWHHISCPYRTGQIIVLCILMFMFLHSTLQNERFWPEWQQGFPKFNLLLLSSWMSGPEAHPASCTMGAKSIKITLDCKKENGRHPSNWCTIKKTMGTKTFQEVNRLRHGIDHPRKLAMRLTKE